MRYDGCTFAPGHSHAQGRRSVEGMEEGREGMREGRNGSFQGHKSSSESVVATAESPAIEK